MDYLRPNLCGYGIQIDPRSLAALIIILKTESNQPDHKDLFNWYDDCTMLLRLKKEYEQFGILYGDCSVTYVTLHQWLRYDHIASSQIILYDQMLMLMVSGQMQKGWTLTSSFRIILELICLRCPGVLSCLIWLTDLFILSGLALVMDRTYLRNSYNIQPNLT